MGEIPIRRGAPSKKGGEFPKAPTRNPKEPKRVGELVFCLGGEERGGEGFIRDYLRGGSKQKRRGAGGRGGVLRLSQGTLRNVYGSVLMLEGTPCFWFERETKRKPTILGRGAWTNTWMFNLRQVKYAITKVICLR